MLQLGEETWVELKALALHMGGSSVMKVEGSQLRAAILSGIGKGDRTVHQLDCGSPALKGLRPVSMCGC